MAVLSRERKIYRVTILGSIVNLSLLAFKFIAGVVGNSAAMVADAIHSLSDFITDIIVLLFVKISSKPADFDHDYGHGKYETLATSFIGIILVGVGATIGWNGLQKIVTVINGGKITQPGKIAFIAAIVSIIVKEWIFIVTKKAGKSVHSSSLEANAWHHRSDALSSIGTAIGIGGAIFFGSKWAVLDPIAAIVVSIFIIVSAFRIIKKALDELLEKSLPEDIEDHIVKLAYLEETVSDIHNIKTRQIGSRKVVEMHIRMPADMNIYDAHIHATNIEHRIKAEYGNDTHIMLHIEPIKENSNE